MKQAVYIGHAQPSILSIVSRIVKNLTDWWNAKSRSFSLISGDRVTHGEVVRTNLVLIAGFLAVAIVCGIIGG